MVRRYTISLIAAVAAVVLLLPAGTVAAGGTQQFGPFASTSADGGSCGVPWANDTFDRYFSVHDNGDGTFRVREQFKNGSFVTIGGTSPGACNDGPNNGHTVPASIVVVGRRRGKRTCQRRQCGLGIAHSHDVRRIARKLYSERTIAI